MILAEKDVPTDVAIEVLRQRHQHYPLAKRRELGESLTSLAIRRPEAASPVLEAIIISGSANPAFGGIANPDALMQLIRIHKEAVGADSRRSSLLYMLDQVDPTRAFPYLREVASVPTGDDPLVTLMVLADFAFSRFSRGSATDRAKAAVLLHELFDKHLVKTGPAATELCEIAFTLKWDVGKRCRGIM